MLVVLDGFGERAETRWNATRLADTPGLTALGREAARGLLEASGAAVGLPDGQMGNSEVGHLTIGAGRAVPQDIVRIDAAIRAGRFEENLELLLAAEAARASGGAVHVLGLTSAGGVHAHTRHGLAIVRALRRAGVPGERIFWHAFLDGRDTPPRAAVHALDDLGERLRPEGARLASAIGRFYAMDRDGRWERTERAYRLLVHADGQPATDVAGAVATSYREGVDDEFVPPIVRVDAAGRPLARVADGDVVVFFNFRSDRMRQLVAALTQPFFDGFARGSPPRLARALGLCQYDASFRLPVMFPPLHPRATLGEVVAQAGLGQLRVAETEKWAHVTWFFDGGLDRRLPGEARRLVPSRADVRTYDEAPAMSAQGITDAVLEGLAAPFGPAFVLVNYANADMVGHTGVLEAAIEAVEALDAQVRRLREACRAAGAALVVTADHGNCELMWDEAAGQPHTAHTTSPVPIWVAAPDVLPRPLGTGSLADVAPTVAELLGLPIPPEWTGRPLAGRPRNLGAGPPIPPP